MRWCAWWSGGKRFDFRYPTNSWSYVYLSNSTDIGGRGLCIIEANSTTGDTKMDSCEYYTHKVYAPYNPTLEQVASGGVIDITTDQYFATMVYANGEVKTFGLNNGALGNGVYVDTSNFDTYKRQAYNPTPVKFILPPGVKAVSSWTTSNGIDSKNGNTFVVTSDGRVFGAGSNVTGQLGIGHVGGGTMAFTLPRSRCWCSARRVTWHRMCVRATARQWSMPTTAKYSPWVITPTASWATIRLPPTQRPVPTKTPIRSAT